MQEQKKPVNVTIKPSEQVVSAAATEFFVEDSKGRTIKLKKPNPLANLDFAKAAGSDKLNVLYLSEVAHLKFVASIDDQVVACPSTEGELRALYQRLGEGNESVQAGVAKHFYGVTSADAEQEEVKK